MCEGVCINVLSAKTAGCRACDLLLELWFMNLVVFKLMQNLIMTIISSINKNSIIGIKHAVLKTSVCTFGRTALYG